MRRVEFQIARNRRETENEEFTATTGIQDQEFIDALVDAQRDMQTAIADQHQNVFIAEKVEDIIGNQEVYPLPDDIFLDNRITNVWFSDTGRTKDNRRLRSGTLTERIFNRSTSPALYIRRNNELLLSPIPRRTVINGLTLNYVQQLPELDVRRAKIASVVLDTNARTITNLTLDTTGDFQRDELLQDSYMCIVNLKGDQEMSRIEFSDIDNTTGIVTVAPGFVYKEGETAANDWYVVRGHNTTNRSELPDTCERYLISYVEWVIHRRDSSADAGESAQELIAMRDSLVSIFKQVDDDVKHITIDDTQFIDDDDLWISY